MPCWRSGARAKRYCRTRDSAGNLRTISDDVRNATLEMVVPAELEMHLLLNRTKLKTFDEVTEEVRLFVELKIGLRIGASSASSASSRDPNAMGTSALGRQKLETQCEKGGSGEFGRKRGQEAVKAQEGGGKKIQVDECCLQCGGCGGRASDCWPKKSGGSKGKAKVKV